MNNKLWENMGGIKMSKNRCPIDLDVQRGIVSSRVALLLRSAETKRTKIICLNAS